ncbi:MAG: MFS transporter [Proteobacteria bacterium]|nr:MAG: MFS transporter [Pseudomonadota bacterium]
MPILSVNVVGTLGFSIVLPFLVSLVTKWGGNALIYGLLGATYSAFQLIGAPILGRWSDRYGRRKILLGAALTALGNGLMWPSGMSRLGGTRRPGLPGHGSRVCERCGRGCQYCRFGSGWAALQLARTVGVQSRGDHDPDCSWAGGKCSALTVAALSYCRRLRRRSPRVTA